MLLFRVSHCKRFLASVVACSVMLVSGCASGPPPLQPNQVRVTFYSEPDGAMLYEGDVAWGQSPQTRIYTATVTTGTIKTKLLTAIWPSGARETIGFTLTLGQGDRFAKFSRPQSASGLVDDLTYANKLKQEREAKAASDRAETSQTWRDLGNALFPKKESSAERKAPSGTVTCIRMSKDIMTCD